MLYLYIINAITLVLYLIAIFARLARSMYVRETPQWWRWTTIYFETRPFIVPHTVLATAIAFLERDFVWGVIDFLVLLFWNWILKKDDDDPEDRWRKRGKRIKVWVSAPFQVLRPVSVGAK